MRMLSLLVVIALTLPTVSFAADATTKTKKKKAPVAKKSEEPKAESSKRSSFLTDVDLPDMSGKFGAGGMVGSLISANAKYWINSKMAVELGLGFGFTGLGGFEPFGDFLYNLGPIFGTQNAVIKRFSMYVGGGAFAMFGTYGGVLGVSGESATEVGFFVPVGVTWMPVQVPNLEVFGQVGPGVGFGSVTYLGTSTSVGGFVLLGGVGARYYFN